MPHSHSRRKSFPMFGYPGLNYSNLFQKETKRHLVPKGFIGTDDEIRMLGYICQRSTQERASNDGWVNVHSERLKEFFGGRYMKVLSSLLDRENRPMLRTESYSAGRFPKALKIKDEVHKDGYTYVKRPRNRRERQGRCYTKLARHHESDAKKEKDEFKLFTATMIDLVRLEGDVTAAVNCECERRMASGEWQNHPKGRSPSLLQSDFRRACDTVILAIQDREWWLTRCGSGRIYTPITSMPKFLRPFLRLDGEPVTLLDIKNSQPCFASALTRKLGNLVDAGVMEFLRQGDGLSTKPGKAMKDPIDDAEWDWRRERCQDEFDNVNTDEFIADAYMDCERRPSSDELACERQRVESENSQFRQQFQKQSVYENRLAMRAQELTRVIECGFDAFDRDTASGTLYETIMEYGGYVSGSKEHRDRVKKGFLSAMYAKTPSVSMQQQLDKKYKDQPTDILDEIGDRHRVREVAAEIYPGLMPFMDILKMESYPAAAISIQRMEADTVLCKEIMQFPCLTIHDCLVVRKRDELIAQRVLQARLEEQGISTKLTLE